MAAGTTTATSEATSAPRSGSSSPPAAPGSLPSRPGCPSTAATAAGCPGCAATRSRCLAGVSPEYYDRLERGNATGVSESVIDGIAHALQLDEAERAHLLDLLRTAGSTRPAAPPPAARSGSGRPSSASSTP